MHGTKVVPIRPDVAPRYIVVLEKATYPQKCKRCGILIMVLSTLCIYFGLAALYNAIM